MKILILGASGMLGSAAFCVLTEDTTLQVFGTLRSERTKRFFADASASRLITGVDVTDQAAGAELFDRLQPEVVINCISLSKPLLSAGNPVNLIPIYGLLPHRLLTLCRLTGARLIHISSDGVFSGVRGGYTEEDPADAADLYGRVKYSGEVSGEQAMTIRTSFIGPELERAGGLLNWFLAQRGRCKGFRKVIFSGLPTVALARIIRDLIIPRPDLCGVYHIAATPISKFDLLRLIAVVYGKSIEIEPDDEVIIDRSLKAERFRAATGYVAPEWPELIRSMRAYQWTGLVSHV